MKKSDLSAHVATEASMTKAQASAVVDAVFSAISDSLARDESVAIPGFGDVLDEDARGPPGPQSAHWLKHRHRRLEVAFVQGRQDPSRRCTRVASHRTGPRAPEVGSVAEKGEMTPQAKSQCSAEGKGLHRSVHRCPV